MRFKRILCVASAVALGLLIVVPYRNSLVRLARLALWLVTASSFLVLIWRNKILRIFLHLTIGAFFAFLLLPGRASPDTGWLRQRFVHQLASYEGVRYVYGGENHCGAPGRGCVEPPGFSQNHK